MEWLLKALRDLKGWQIGALVAVVLASFGATYGVYTIVESRNQQGLGENQRLIPVQLGNLSNDVAISGNIEFPNKETLYFGTTGTVAEVLVSEGQEVTEGQALVSLDPETISGLRKSVAEARISVMQAEQALEEAMESNLETAEAEAAVADARLALETAEDEIDDLLNPDSQLVAEAESKLATGKLTLKNVQKDMDELLSPDAQAVAEAESAVAQGRIALEDAQEALGDELVDAISELNAATKDLQAARQDLELAGEEITLRNAQDALDDAEESYRDLFDRWFGIKLTEEEMYQHHDALFDTWGVVLSDFEKYDYVIFPNGKLADDPSTRWNELKIFPWLRLHPNSVGRIVLVACEEDDQLTPQQTCIERQFDEAWDVLEETQRDFSDLESQTDRNISQAEADIIRTEKALEDAQKAVNRLSDGGAGAERLQKDYVVAQETLANARKDLDELLNPDPVEVESKRNEVVLAQANVAQAEKELAELLEPKQTELTSKQNRVVVEEAALTKAERDLANLIARRDLDIALKETELADAEATLKGGLTRLENANLVSPFDGYVVAIHVERGEELEEISPVIEVLDRGVVRVDGSVDEIDVLSLQLGSQAAVTMDALSGRTLTGIVTRISSAGTNQSGVVTFAVEVDIEVPEGVTLQEGMTAVANVSVAQISGLLVPNQAIQGTFDNPQVVVMNGRGPETRSVLLGDSDGFWTVVEGGLVEGEQVVMEVQDAQTQQVGFGGGFRGGGGGGSVRVATPR